MSGDRHPRPPVAASRAGAGATAGRGAAAPVTICLALRDGGPYLADQLASIAAQQGADWRLLVSDDGSGDVGPAMVRGFARNRPAGQVVLLRGPRRGAARNFLHLIAQAPPEAPLAFCDQDDLWLPNRLADGLAVLATAGTGPVIHAGRTVICDAGLRPVAPGPARRSAAPGLARALVQAGAPGNTMLLSPAAVRLLQRGLRAAQAAAVPAHDWWAHQLVAGAGGRLIRTPSIAVLYRQHGGNLMGRNDTLAAARRRAGLLLDGTFGGWLAANLAALESAAELLTPASRELVRAVRRALLQPGPEAARRLTTLGLRREGHAGTAALLAAAALGALHPEAHRRRPEAGGRPSLAPSGTLRPRLATTGG